MDEEINAEFVRQVAKNANLVLSDDEIKAFEQDFKEILNNFDKLSNAVVADNPSFHPVNVCDNMRNDEIGESISHDKAMKNVKSKSDGYIRGPKVL